MATTTTDRLTGTVAGTITQRFTGTPAGTISDRILSLLLLSGDMTDGDDHLLLSGDMTDGNDRLLLSGDARTAAPNSTLTDRLP